MITIEAKKRIEWRTAERELTIEADRQLPEQPSLKGYEVVEGDIRIMINVEKGIK